jgi:hypothetical protein
LTACNPSPSRAAARAVVAVALLCALCSSCLPAANADSPGTSTITAAQMKDYLSFIASDEMEGRATPSRGLDTAAKFIATLLDRWGVKPVGDDGGYFQKIALSAKRALPAECAVTLNGRTLAYGEGYFTRSASGAGAASGRVVYAGDGWMVKSTGVDAFRGLDVKGKTVLVNLDAGRRRGRLQGAPGVDWADPVTNAKRSGATAIVFLAGENANWAALRSADERLRYSVDRLEPTGGAPDTDLPVIVLGSAQTRELFAGEKADAAAVFRSIAGGAPVGGFELTADKRLAVKTAVETVKATSQNVVGVIEGSDPALRGEYVGLSAHLDHLGLADTPVNGDRVYNGADDDGSGSTAVLAIAEAASHAKRRPRRSLLFVWHMGEERGLWGSRYFTEYPTIPLKQLTAQINIDMIGRSKAAGDTNPANHELTGPDSIYVIGATMMSSGLDALCRSVNDHYLKLQYDFKYDDPKDPNRFFYRSDHINYARKGVPILFFFDGVHEDYHRLGDEVQKIDFGKMQRVTRTIYQTLWELGCLRERLKVDKPTPEQLR